MRVLHVYKDFAPVVGGIENHVRWLAAGLARKPDVDVSVLVTNRGPRTVREVVDGVPVTKAGRQYTLASAPLSLGLLYEIGRRPYDIIHLHFPYPIGELAYLLHGRARKLVITYHSDIVRQKHLLRMYRPFLHLLLQRADAILTSSPNYASGSPFLSRHLDKITIVPLAIDASRFGGLASTEARAAQIRQELGGPMTLFVGELRYYKSVHVLIQAMRRVAGSLAVVGGGPEETKLKAQAAREDLAGRVVFRGRVPDDELAAHYQAADLFVLPSGLRAEAYGMVLLEAQTFGLPLVTTELGTGTSYVNRHGTTGIVVPPHDAGALARAIMILQSSPELRRAYGEAGRRRLENELSMGRMVDNVYNLYGKLLNGD